ncbi:MAG: bifunctional folylpolyglutamate synthase/dihydrofolate synthase [Rikenellaceae bacterium]|nr:bifunctional folylpolyglutamate synthase/dihydrofolate synthase [Rikenellaceae bacterium]
MTYAETLDYLFHALPSFQNIGSDAYKPGLDNILSFCRTLGNPQRSYRTIHVAGTNGKGSVSHTIASVLQSAGYHVGLFTSPHLLDFRERIRVDGQMIAQEDVVGFVERYKERMEQLGLSFFEMTAALAFKYFQRCSVDVAVIEVGLGGRLDATNIITPELSVITNIGLDHTALLGNTIGEIAREKAGIIKRGVPVIIGESHPESDEVFEQVAVQMTAPICFADQAFECVDVVPVGGGRSRYTIEARGNGTTRELEYDLQGLCQRKNIVTAFTALKILHDHTDLGINNRALREGFRDAAFQTGLMGRWQTIGHEPLTICDTAHNAHGLRDAMAQVVALEAAELWMVLGVVSDKDVDSILPLMPRGAHYVFTRAGVERALPAEVLAERFRVAGIEGEVVGSVAEAVAYARERAPKNGVVYVGGSTFVVAEAL